MIYYLVTCGVTVTIPSTILDTTFAELVTSTSYTYLPAVRSLVLADVRDRVTNPLAAFKDTVKLWALEDV